MIRLLQNEIVAEPGRAPQQPGLDGEVGPGSAALRLTNTTDQENAYMIRLRCDANPHWQDADRAVDPAGLGKERNLLDRQLRAEAGGLGGGTSKNLLFGIGSAGR